MTRFMFSMVMFVVPVLLGTSAAAKESEAGAVYVMTNAAGGNEVIAYSRAEDGRLTLVERVATGGLGGGAAPPIQPIDPLGAQAPLILSEDGRWLIAANPGSDELSVFRVCAHGLELTQIVPSGGAFPASLTLRHRLLYVLNSGGEGNITGFILGNNGRLTPLAGSTRSLNASGSNPPFFLVSPAQVGFSPGGDFLAVTVKGTNLIHVFPVDSTGLPAAAPTTTMSSGSTPFGFLFDRRGHLIVTEVFGRASVGTPSAGAVSSYEVQTDGSLRRLSVSVENHQTATCWAASTRNGQYIYFTNNGSGTLSAYRVDAFGQLSLLDASGISATTGLNPVDIAVSRDNRFVYALNTGSGTVSMYRIDPSSGQLTSLGEVSGLPILGGAVGITAR